jgi:hypothetical protein
MPEISRFFGIVVAMFYSDHAPPHFHARYGEYEVTVRIDDGGVDGYFPLGTGSDATTAAENRATGVNR